MVGGKNGLVVEGGRWLKTGSWWLKWVVSGENGW